MSVVLSHGSSVSKVKKMSSRGNLSVNVCFPFL